MALKVTEFDLKGVKTFFFQKITKIVHRLGALPAEPSWPLAVGGSAPDPRL